MSRAGNHTSRGEIGSGGEPGSATRVEGDELLGLGGSGSPTRVVEDELSGLGGEGDRGVDAGPP
jgi:hypothetical protein